MSGQNRTSPWSSASSLDVCLGHHLILILLGKIHRARGCNYLELSSCHLEHTGEGSMVHTSNFDNYFDLEVVKPKAIRLLSVVDCNNHHVR